MIMALKSKILAIAGTLFVVTHSYANNTTDSSTEWIELVRLENILALSRVRKLLPKELQNEVHKKTIAAFLSTLPRYIENLSIQEPKEMCAANFNQDGSRIVSASSDTVTTRDSITGKVIGCFRVYHTRYRPDVHFNTDASRVAYFSFDGSAQLWNTTTGKLIQNFVTPQGCTSTAHFNNDSSRIITNSGLDSNTLRMWDTVTGKQTQHFIGHTDYILAAQFNDNSSQITSVSRDRTIRTWDTATGEEIKQIRLPLDYIGSAQFSGNRELLATGKTMLQIWNTATGQEIQHFTEDNGYSSKYGFKSAHFNHDTSRLLTGDLIHGDLQILDITTGQKLATLLGHRYYVNSVKFNHNGSQLASASGDRTLRTWIDVKKTLGDESKTPLYDLKIHELIMHLFLYKKFLKHFHKNVDRITFGGLAKFLNQRLDVPQVTEDGLKNIYCGMNRSLKAALRALFYTHYATT